MAALNRIWKLHGDGRVVSPGDVVRPDERLGLAADRRRGHAARDRHVRRHRAHPHPYEVPALDGGVLLRDRHADLPRLSCATACRATSARARPSSPRPGRSAGGRNPGRARRRGGHGRRILRDRAARGPQGVGCHPAPHAAGRHRHVVALIGFNLASAAKSNVESGPRSRRWSRSSRSWRSRAVPRLRRAIWRSCSGWSSATSRPPSSERSTPAGGEVPRGSACPNSTSDAAHHRGLGLSSRSCSCWWPITWARRRRRGDDGASNVDRSLGRAWFADGADDHRGRLPAE